MIVRRPEEGQADEPGRTDADGRTSFGKGGSRQMVFGVTDSQSDRPRYVQGWTKRWTCGPGKVWQKFLATYGPPYSPSLYV